MEQKINLKQLEKNTAAGIYQTGIIEIGIGLIFVISSLAMIFDDISYYLMVLYIVLPALFIVLAKKYIADPRIGVYKLTSKRMRKRMKMMITVTAFLVIMVTLTIFGTANSVADFINPRWIISGIIFFICIAIAFFLDFDRMYIYAFLLTGAFYLSEEIRENSWLVSENGYAYMLVSIILIVIGCVYLIRFLQKYPLPEEEVSYDK